MNAILATSDWCGTCKVLKAELEKGGISVEEKSLTEDPEFFIENNIKSLPTLVTEGGMINGAKNILEYFKISA